MLALRAATILLLAATLTGCELIQFLKMRDPRSKGTSDTGEAMIGVHDMMLGPLHAFVTDPAPLLDLGYRDHGILFYLLAEAAPDTHPIYLCIDHDTGGFHLSGQSDCEGKQPVKVIGYAGHKPRDGWLLFFRCRNGGTGDYYVAADQSLCDQHAYYYQGDLGYAALPQAVR